MKKVILLGLVCIACVWAGLTLGSEFLSPPEVVRLFFSDGGARHTVFFKIRLPRVAVGFFVGAGLAIAGAAFQALLRNPLAESYTLGISGGASLGICIGILAGAGIFVPLCAFAGALLSVFIILSIGSRRHFANPTLILLGVILNFVFSSFVLFLLALLRMEKFQETFFWLIGDLAYFPNGLFLPGMAAIFIACLLLFTFSGTLDVISMGEEKAQTLGTDVVKTRKTVFIIASFIVGICVSLGGMIGFVGLIVPHATRIVFGSAHRKVLPACFILGGGMLVVADGAARSLIPPLEIPVGVITGFFGGLFFLFLLMNTRRRTLW